MWPAIFAGIGAGIILTYLVWNFLAAALYCWDEAEDGAQRELDWFRDQDATPR